MIYSFIPKRNIPSIIVHVAYAMLVLTMIHKLRERQNIMTFDLIAMLLMKLLKKVNSINLV